MPTAGGPGAQAPHTRGRVYRAVTVLRQQQKRMPFAEADHTDSHLESKGLLPLEFLHQWKEHARYWVQIYHFQELKAISKYIRQYKNESAINL